MTPPSTPVHRRWQIVLAVLISAGFLYWALKGIHFHEVMAELRRVRLAPLVACIAIATSTFVLRIFRWRILLRAEDGGPLPAGALWHAIAIGFMANNVLPFRAGEVLRSIAITRLTRTRLSAAFSSIAAERLFDGVALVLVLMFGLLMSGLPPRPRSVPSGSLISPSSRQSPSPAGWGRLRWWSPFLLRRSD